MKLAVFAVAAVAASGCTGRTATQGSAQASAPTRLQIEISIRGSEAPTKVWTLECPAAGTLPSPARACRKLDRLRRPFAEPKVRVCTQIYGGPQIADVHGIYKGRPVNAHFDRGNGCEIERWNRLRFLFPTS